MPHYQRRHVCCFFILLFAYASTISATRAAVASTLSELRVRLKGSIEHPRFHRAQFGVKVIFLPTGKTIFDHQSDKLFRPASNAKLFTGAFALDKLGPAFRIQTSAYASRKPAANGKLNGDLILYGRGDPTFSPRFHSGDVRKPFQRFARAIVVAGIKSVSGDIVADESYFNIEPFGSGWVWDDLREAYGAEISALNVNDNAASITLLPGTTVGTAARVSTSPDLLPIQIINRVGTHPIGTPERIVQHWPFLESRMTFAGTLARDSNGRVFSITVRRPAHWFGQMLARELKLLGVVIGGKVHAVNWTERLLNPLPSGQLEHISSVAAPPLLEIIRVMMKDSVNLYANLMLLQAAGPPTENGKDAERWALEQLQQFLLLAGVESGAADLDDGSGLSRRTLVSPSAVVRLLSFMSEHQYAKEFASTLAIAGQDGTLANRMKQSAAEKNAIGKTGTLKFAHGLSGYVTTKADERLAFSILLNNYDGSSSSAREAMDALVVSLAEFEGKLE